MGKQIKNQGINPLHNEQQRKIKIKKILLVLILWGIMGNLTWAARYYNFEIPNLRGLEVAVITDSISCSHLAKYILRKNGITESSLESADVILTVVRSSGSSPLYYHYDSLDELREDIEHQINISGSKGHIYVFTINEKLETEEIFHSSFGWQDSIEDLY